MTIHHRRDRAHHTRPIDPRRHFHRQLLREPRIPAPTPDHEPPDRGQRHPPHTTTGQLLEHHRHRILGQDRDLSQPGDSLTLEHIPRREHHTPRLRPRDQLNRDNRVPTQREERLIDTDPLHPEHIGEHLRDDLLDPTLRRPEHPRLHHRLRQSLPIDLPVDRQRQRIEHHHRRRHHMRRQRRPHEIRQFHRIHHSRRRRHHIRHQNRCTGSEFPINRDHGPHTRMHSERRIDLTELDPETTHLHLKIRAPHILEHQIRRPPHHITSAIQPRTRLTERIRHEPLRRQTRPTVIPPSQRTTSQIQLTRRTRNHRPQPRIKHQRRHPGNRPTHRHRPTRRQLRKRRNDRRLRRTIPIEIPATRRPLRQQIRSRHITTNRNNLELLEPHRINRAQHCRSDNRVRHPLITHQPRQLRPTKNRRRHNHQPRTHRERRHPLQHRRIETRRTNMQEPRRRTHPIQPGSALQHTPETRMSDTHTLRQPRRTRGIDHIRHISRPQRRHPIRISNRPPRQPLTHRQQRRIINNQPRHPTRQPIHKPTPGQPHHRTGITQQKTNPLHRITRINRHIRSTRLRHRPHRENHLERPRKRQRHHRLRTHPTPNQQPRQPRRPLIKLPIRHRPAPNPHRHRIRIHTHTRSQNIRQQPHRHNTPTMNMRQHRTLIPRQHLNITHQHTRIRNHSLENPHKPIHKRHHSRLIKQIRRIRELPHQTRRSRVCGEIFPERHREIEFRNVGIEFDCADRQPGQLERRPTKILESQRHLKQRMTRRRPLRIEHLHQPLERHIRMPESTQITLTNPRQKIRKTPTRNHPRPQHQSIDEHPDHIIKSLLTTTRNRRPHRNIITTRQTRQQHRQRRMHHHEHRRITVLGQLDDTTMSRRRDREGHRVARVRRIGWSPLVDGQIQLIRKTGQHRHPIRFLLRDQRLRIILATEHLPLPQRIIRILHLEWTPTRHLPLRPRNIRRHHIPRQRTHRKTIRRNVMHHKHQHMLSRRHLEQRRPHRHPRRHIKPSRHQVHHPVQHHPLGHPHRRQIRNSIRNRNRNLKTHTIDLRIHRPQRLVPRHHIRHRRLQRSHIQRPRQPNRHRNIIHRRTRLEPIQKPHPRLRQRQRHPPRTRAGLQSLPATETRVRLRGGRQCFHRGRLEQGRQRDLCVQSRTQPCDQLGCDQRVAAQREEVIVESDTLDPENFSENSRHNFFDRSRRCSELRCRENRSREGCPIQLAHRREGDFVEHRHHGRNHVAGQFLCDELEQHRSVDLRACDRQNVRHQRGRSGHQLAPHGGGEFNIGMRSQRCVDLPQFDPETADLDLEIAPTEVFVSPVLAAPDHVAGPVQPFACVSERARHKAFGRQAWTA
ncbi:hypothetical protein MLGJGCBP_03261 [Rhodococcus sp. T7]|nr:hypothetical protein MLGJGCBP_03261 [Rhodococcus sp. T7]